MNHKKFKLTIFLTLGFAELIKQYFDYLGSAQNMDKLMIVNSNEACSFKIRKRKCIMF